MLENHIRVGNQFAAGVFSTRSTMIVSMGALRDCNSRPRSFTDLIIGAPDVSGAPASGTPNEPNPASAANFCEGHARHRFYRQIQSDLIISFEPRGVHNRPVHELRQPVGKCSHGDLCHLQLHPAVWTWRHTHGSRGAAGNRATAAIIIDANVKTTANARLFLGGRFLNLQSMNP